MSEEGEKEILDMEPLAKWPKDFIKRVLWAEAASCHPKEVKLMESEGLGPLGNRVSRRTAKPRNLEIPFCVRFKIDHHVCTEAVWHCFVEGQDGFVAWSNTLAVYWLSMKTITCGRSVELR